MKNEIDNRLVIAVVAALVLVLGFFGWRMFSSGTSGDKVSPQQAGLGKPLYPAGQGQGQMPNSTPPAGR